MRIFEEGNKDVMRLPSIRSSPGIWFVVATIFSMATAPAAPTKPVATAKTSAVARTKSAAPGSGGKHCLWRITNAKAPVYLLGSIHSLRPSDYPLPPIIEGAIQQAQQFYFEYDPKRDDELSSKLGGAARLPGNVEIKQKVNPKTYEYLKKISRGGYNWTHLRAWAIAHYELNYPVREHPIGAYGLDNYVEGKARALHRPMFGLETVDEHVAVFSGMSDIESEVYLLEAIVFANQRDARFRQTVAAWKVGNTQQMFALEMPEIKDAPGLNSRFLDVRNARWIPVIEGAIKSGVPTIVVAGAMHFSGPKSVLGMLQARGYHIEQL
ncbi:MAG: uncharacterized protein QOG48_1393 [Verrucomicrobiota bacterium]